MATRSPTPGSPASVDADNSADYSAPVGGSANPKRPKNQKHCSYCGEPGHYRNTCPKWKADVKTKAAKDAAKRAAKKQKSDTGTASPAAGPPAGSWPLPAFYGSQKATLQYPVGGSLAAVSPKNNMQVIRRQALQTAAAFGSGAGSSKAAAEPDAPDVQCMEIEQKCESCDREANFGFTTCCPLCKQSQGKQHTQECDHNHAQITAYNDMVKQTHEDFRRRLQQTQAERAHGGAAGKKPAISLISRSPSPTVVVKPEKEAPPYTFHEKVLEMRKKMYEGVSASSGLYEYHQDRNAVCKFVLDFLDKFNADNNFKAPLCGMSHFSLSEVDGFKKLEAEGYFSHATNIMAAIMIMWPLLDAYLNGERVDLVTARLGFKVAGELVNKTMFPGSTRDQVPYAAGSMYGPGTYFSTNAEKVWGYMPKNHGTGKLLPTAVILNLLVGIPGATAGFKPHHFLAVSPQIERNDNGMREKFHTFITELKQHQKDTNMPLEDRVLFVVVRMMMWDIESHSNDQFVCLYPEELIQGVHSTRALNGANYVPAFCGTLQNADLLKFSDPFRLGMTTTGLQVGDWFVTKEKYDWLVSKGLLGKVQAFRPRDLRTADSFDLTQEGSSKGASAKQDDAISVD